MIRSADALRDRPRRPRVRVPQERRAELLQREQEACGPHTFLLRVYAALESAKTGDARMLAGHLEDVAAAALVWQERTINDWTHHYKPPNSKAA